VLTVVVAFQGGGGPGGADQFVALADVPTVAAGVDVARRRPW